MAANTGAETASVMRKALALAQSQLSNYRTASTGLRAADGRKETTQGKDTPTNHNAVRNQKK